MATEGLHQRLNIKLKSWPPIQGCQEMSCPRGLRRNPMETLNIRCLQRGGGAALIQNNINLLNQRGSGSARAMRPEQAKQIIRHKGVLTVEAAAKSLRESSTFLSTTEHSVSYAETKHQEPSARKKCPECAHALPFYRKYDVMLTSYVRMFQAQWWESL